VPMITQVAYETLQQGMTVAHYINKVKKHFLG